MSKITAAFAKLEERFNKKEEAEPVVEVKEEVKVEVKEEVRIDSEEVALLKEIRDLLKENNGKKRVSKAKE
jgi:hypothetical protein